MRRRRRESIQEKQARSFCLLANSNGQRRKPIHVRMGGSALHHHRQHWTTRREESSGRAGVGLKPRRPSRGGSRPAPAERGRDRHWHWQAASCRAVLLVLEFLEACVCWWSACAARGRLAGRSQPPSEFRRSVAPLRLLVPPAAPHLLRLQIFTATSTHLYFLSNTAGRSWFSWTRAGVPE